MVCLCLLSFFCSLFLPNIISKLLSRDQHEGLRSVFAVSASLGYILHLQGRMTIPSAMVFSLFKIRPVRRRRARRCDSCPMPNFSTTSTKRDDNCSRGGVNPFDKRRKYPFRHDHSSRKAQSANPWSDANTTGPGNILSASH